MIPYGKQDITQQDIDAVVEVLTSDFLTQGPKVPEFESSLLKYTGAKFAVAVNSATSALHIACLALGLSKGDWLWTSPITFVASANCALYCGASVDFVDVDFATNNISVDALKKSLEIAKAEDRLPKVVVAVHLSGQSCNMKAIKSLADQYGFYVIEDASHAIGGKYHNSPVGGCQYSDIAVFSFHPVKIITTAEGGVAVSNDKKIADRMRLFGGHGVTREQSQMNQVSHGPWYYQQIELGYNYRMTELQAALGISQLRRVDSYVDIRNKLALRYDKLLADLPILLPVIDENNYSSFHLYIIKLQLEKIGITHKKVFEYMREKHIGVNLHYIPVFMQPYYEEMGYNNENYPNAIKYYNSALSLPLYVGLSEEDQNFIVDCLREILLCR